MAAESVRAASSVCNFNGSQRRPTTPLPRTPFLLRSSRPSSSFSLSSRSQFFGTNLRFSSLASSQLCNSRHQNRRNLSVFAMAAEGILSCPSIASFSILRWNLSALNWGSSFAINWTIYMFSIFFEFSIWIALGMERSSNSMCVSVDTRLIF